MIDEPLDKLRKHMLSYEPSDAELSQRYRREVDALLHRKLDPGRRRAGIIGGTGLVLYVLLAAILVPWTSNQFPPPFWGMFIVGTGYMGLLGLAMLILGILRISPHRYQMIFNAVGFAGVAVMGVLLLHGSWQIEDPQARGQLHQVAFIFLGIAGVSIILHLIQDYHKQTRLKLLELEYRLADLATKIERK